MALYSFLAIIPASSNKLNHMAFPNIAKNYPTELTGFADTLDKLQAKIRVCILNKMRLIKIDLTDGRTNLYYLFYPVAFHI